MICEVSEHKTYSLSNIINEIEGSDEMASSVVRNYSTLLQLFLVEIRRITHMTSRHVCLKFDVCRSCWRAQLPTATFTPYVA